MKKIIKTAIMALVLCSGWTLQTTAKGKMEPRYVFGFSASFADSTVYFTDIQKLDSTWIDTKSKFLLGREQYSSQLKAYFNSKGMPNRTCIIMFDKDQKKVEKKLKKLKDTYTVKAKGGYDVHYMPAADFQFTPVYMGIDEEPVAKQPKKEKGKKAKNKK